MQDKTITFSHSDRIGNALMGAFSRIKELEELNKKSSDRITELLHEVQVQKIIRKNLEADIKNLETKIEL